MPGSGARRGFTLWLTGLSGAGKSTIASAVADRLRAEGAAVEVLDGDEVREHLSKGLSFSREDRDINVRRIAYVAKLLCRNGVAVITAAISPYRSTRDEARRDIGDGFIEVYVNASLDECIRRDVKGLYEKALAGAITTFTGVSDPYEAPLAPDVEVNTERETIDESVERVLETIRGRGFLSSALQSTSAA
ncbi:MAG: adenylyl-sulfate kinase [Gemmatimonadaceae bacterium]